MANKGAFFTTKEEKKQKALNDNAELLKTIVQAQTGAAAAPAAAPSAAPEAAGLTTEQKYTNAQRDYEDYRASEERQQRQRENNRAALQEAMERIFAVPGASASDMPLSTVQVKPREDAKEQELKAAADYYERQTEAEENQRVMDSDLRELDTWSDEDKQLLQRYITERDQNQYNFLAGPQFDTYNLNPLIQKYGEGKVKQMAESYQRSQNAQTMERIDREARDGVSTKGGAIGHSAASVGANVLDSLTAPLGYAVELQQRTGRYSTLDPNNAGGVFGQYGGAVRDQVTQNILGEDPTWLNNLGAMAYQGGMSAADSFTRALLGRGIGGPEGTAALSAALASTGTFGNSLRQYSAQGASPGEAAAMALASAGLEYVTEKIPLDKLLNIAEGGKVPTKKIISDALKQVLIAEPGTEEINLLANVAAETLILREKGSHEQRIQELVAGGMPYDQAKETALRELWMEAAETYAVSAIAAAPNTGIAAVTGTVNNRRATKTQEATNGVQETQAAEAAPAAPVMEEAQQAQNEQPPSMPEEAAPQSAGSPLDNAVNRFHKDGVISNKTAEAILADPASVAQLQEQTGVEITGTKSQMRDAVKIAVRKMAGGDVPMTSEGHASIVEDLTDGIEQMPEEAPAPKTEGQRHFDNAAAIANDMEPEQNNVDSHTVQEYNNTRSEQMQTVIDRLNNSGDTAPTIEEIMSIPEIAEAEQANEGIPTIELPNREQIREEGYQKAIKKGSWNGKDYSGEVRQDRRMDIVIGLPGSGKSSVYTERLSQEHKSRVIDTDDFREYIPEYNGSNASIVHEEASKIRGDVFDTAMDNGDNILLSTIGANAEKLVAQIAGYKADGYQVYLHLNELPNRKSQARAIGRYKSEDGSLGRYVSPRLIAEYGDKPTQTYLYLTGQGGTENGELGRNLRQSGRHGTGTTAQTGGTPEGATGTAAPADLLAGYDWYNNDVERGEAPRLIQSSAQIAPQTDTQNAAKMGAGNVSEQSTEGGQATKGTGAAEQNFSGKPAYNAALSEDNAQADRRDDVRPMELPERDINGGNVSAVTGNVYGSKITPDEFASLMEESAAKGDFTYAKITNDQATQRATEIIASAGTWENAYDSWKQSVTSGNAGAEMSARGALFLNHAAQQGNKQLWLETLHYMQKLGTNTAQGLQAFRIIRTLNPADKVEFVKMSIGKMATEIKEKYGIDLEVDQTLIDKFEEAETDADRDAVLEDIQQNVADQIPSTFLDKWTALRYMNMLGNLKTTVRNAFGNIGNAAIYRIKDTIATGMEAIAYKVSDGKTERTKSLFVDSDLLKACKEDFRQVKETVNGGGKYGDRMSASSQFEQGVQDKRTIFKSDFKNPIAKGVADTLMKPAEWYRKGTNWMMNNEYFGDEAFGKAAYSRALAGYLQANGVTGSDLSEVDSTLLDKARTYAIKEAQEATFHDNSALAKIVSKVQKDTGVVGQGIMPFTKTPANVLTRAEEFSPLGLINSTVKSVQKATGNENITGADIINSWAKSITGVGLFALGAVLMDQGLLTGGPDEDEEEAAFDELNGQQNYAIRLPNGTNYTIDWLTPAAMPMFMGTQFWKLKEENESLSDLTFADMEQVFTSIADPMIQMSMLQGLNDSLDGIKYSDNNLGQFFINSAVSYLTQGLTNTLMGQLERSTEENRQTTYIDKDSDTPEWLQRQLGKASQKIPGWDYQQMDYQDAWGRKEKNEGGLLYNLASPGYISTEHSSRVSEELYRLHEATGANVFPQPVEKTVNYTDNDGNRHTGYNLSQDELKTMQQVAGQTSEQILMKMISSNDYAALSDEQKAEAVRTAYSYAKEKAEITAIEGHHGYSEAWMEALPTGGEASAIVARVAAASLDNAAGSLKTAWDEGWEDSGRADDMQWAYDTFANLNKDTQTAVLDQVDTMTANYIEARSEGIPHEDVLNVAELLQGIAGAGDVQKVETIVGYAGISEAEKAVLVKQQVSDAQDKNIDDLKRMGYGVEDFAKLYRDYEDYTSGTGKKKRTCEKWAADYGISYSAAEALYDVFSKS